MNEFEREPYPCFIEMEKLLVKTLKTIPKDVIKYEIMPLLFEKCNTCNEYIIDLHTGFYKGHFIKVCACCFLLISEYNH